MRARIPKATESHEQLLKIIKTAGAGHYRLVAPSADKGLKSKWRIVHVSGGSIVIFILENHSEIQKSWEALRSTDDIRITHLKNGHIDVEISQV